MSQQGQLFRLRRTGREGEPCSTFLASSLRRASRHCAGRSAANYALRRRGIPDGAGGPEWQRQQALPKTRWCPAMATATKHVSHPPFARGCDRTAWKLEDRARRREANGGGQR